MAICEEEDLVITEPHRARGVVVLDHYSAIVTSAESLMRHLRHE